MAAATLSEGCALGAGLQGCTGAGGSELMQLPRAGSGGAWRAVACRVSQRPVSPPPAHRCEPALLVGTSPLRATHPPLPAHPAPPSAPRSKSVVDDLKPDFNITSKKAQVPYCVSLAWSADGSTLYSGYTDGQIRVWAVGH